MSISNQRDVAGPRAAVLAGAAVAAATLVAAQTYLSMLHHGHDWWRLFLWQLPSWGYWAFMAPFLLRVGAGLVTGAQPTSDEREVERGRARSPAFLAALCAVLVLSHIVFSALILVALQPFQPVSRMDLFGAITYMGLPWTLVDVLLFWLLVVVGRGVASRRHTRSLELREAHLAAELARAQLETLRLKIQPHFLFNTLNSIAALVRRRNNDDALDMIIELSHLLRLSLDRSESQVVPLERELDFVERYVELQRRRFADRLAFESHVDDGLAGVLVPSLVLQPLVENSIRHGLEPATRPVTISLTVERSQPFTSDDDAGVTIVRVEDDGVGLPEGFDLDSAAGVGLGGIRERLGHLYGERPDASLSVMPGRGGRGTCVELQLPVQALRESSDGATSTSPPLSAAG